MFGENIKKIRESKGLGLNELARLAGVNASYLSALERGEKENPTVTTLKKVADALEVTIDELMRSEPITEEKLKKWDKNSTQLKKEVLIIKLGNIIKKHMDNSSKGLAVLVGEISNFQNLGSKYTNEELNRIILDLKSGKYSENKMSKSDFIKLLDCIQKSLGIPDIFIQVDVDEIYDDVENKNQIKEESALYETGEFKTAEEAMQFILKQPSIMGFGGFDTNKMSDEEIIEFANELLNLLKMLGPKYNK